MYAQIGNVVHLAQFDQKGNELIVAFPVSYSLVFINLLINL